MHHPPLPHPSSPKQDRSAVWLIALGLLILFLVSLPFLLTWIATSSRVSGSEFSPDTFQTRTFQYFRVPGIRLQLYSTRYSQPQATPGASFDILKHLQNKSSQSPRWDLVEAQQGATTEKYPAALLVGALEIRNSTYTPLWEHWSAAHPAKAAILWPLVQQLALDGQYLLIPQLLSNALESEEPQTIEAHFHALRKP